MTTPNRYVEDLEDELDEPYLEPAPNGFVYCIDHRYPELVALELVEDHERLHVELAAHVDKDQGDLFDRLGDVTAGGYPPKDGAPWLLIQR